MYSDVVWDWLGNALDSGITEKDFWEMTIDELARAIESKNRILRIEAKEKATFYYTLADLIGRSVGRIHSSTITLPSINEVFPSLFDAKEIEDQQRKIIEEQSVNRFKQFAAYFNKLER